MASFADAVAVFCPRPPTDPNKQALTTAGLFVSGSEKSVPLRIRSVSSKVYCDTSFADTTETFAFIADEDVSVVFKFPLPPRSAVYKLEAAVGDRTITTEVKAREEAQQEFDQAVQQGHTAVIAKQEDSSQIFSLELGNLAAMEEALVHVKYLRVLDSVGGALEFVHTSTWTPPYLGSKGDQERGADHAADNNPRFASKVHYTLSYHLELLSDRGFKAVESPEPITVQDVEPPQPAAGRKTAVKRVTMSEQVADPSKDLTLLVELQPLDSGAHAVSGADGFAQVSVMECDRAAVPGGADGAAAKATRKKRVALATFVPRALVSAKVDDGALEPLNLELVLIVDCSGSMMGPRIDQARESALYFIKDLPAKRAIKFNVVCFGSSSISWSEAGCKDFDEANMKSAVEWVQQYVVANLGGTEILQTLKGVYAMPVTPGFTRQVVFMTDGGISGSEEQAVFDLVQGGKGHLEGSGVGAGLLAGIQKLKDRVLGGGGGAQHHKAGGEGGGGAEGSGSGAKAVVPAVHCLGIGYGVHRGLLDGIARRTGAVAQYVVDGESIARKTAFLSKAALSGRSAIYAPHLVRSPGVVRAVPAALPPRLFPEEALHVLVELDANKPPAQLQVEGRRGDGSPWSLAVPLAAAEVTQGDAYAVLQGMVYVSGLLDGTSHLHLSEQDGAPLDPQPTPEQVKAEVTRAALEEQLVTRHTAAVGVLLQKDPLDPSQVKKVEVPLATPHGALLFQEQDQAMGFGGAMPMMAACSVAPRARSNLTRTFAGPPMAKRQLMAAPMMAAMVAPPPPPAPGGAYGGGAVPEVAHLAYQMRLEPQGPPAVKASGPVRPRPNADAAPVQVIGPDGLPVPGVTAAPAGTGTASDFFAAFGSGNATDMSAPGGGGGGGGGAVESLPLVADSVIGVAAPEEQDDDEGGRVKEAEEAAGSGGGAGAGGKVVAKTPREVLDLLNLRRGLEGSWEASDEVLEAVTSQVAGPDADEAQRKAAAEAARAGRPSELSADQWATVLALAFLRKRCAPERGVWEGMEGKAMSALQAGWPAGFKSVGVTVLQASKLV